MKNHYIEKFIAGCRAKGESEEDITKKVGYLIESPKAYPALSLMNRVDAVCKGDYYAVSWPWKDVSKLCPSLVPGTVTMFAGAPGASKTFTILQCITHWSQIGEKVCSMALESDQGTLMNRLQAQMSECSDMLDLEWIKANPAVMAKAMSEKFNDVCAVGSCVHITSLGLSTYYDVLNWIEDRGEEGREDRLQENLHPDARNSGRGRPAVLPYPFVSRIPRP